MFAHLEHAFAYYLNFRSRPSGHCQCRGDKGIAWRFIAAMMTTPSMIASVQYSP